MYFDIISFNMSDNFSTIDGGEGGRLPPSSVLNATASSPGVRLRITSDTGQDVAGTRIGERLFLRVEMEEGSIFGMLARNLPRGNSDQENIQLLDDRGCPTEPLIFSGVYHEKYFAKTLYCLTQSGSTLQLD